MVNVYMTNKYTVQLVKWFNTRAEGIMFQISFIILFQIPSKSPHFYSRFPSLCLHLFLLYLCS